MILKLIFLGDIDDHAGMVAVEKILPRLSKQYSPDFIIANAENASEGLGLIPEDGEKLFSYGIKVITMGNHTWVKKEIKDYIDKKELLIRPINYPENTPGKGACTFEVNGIPIAIINALGRESIVNIFGKETFSLLDDPFIIVEKKVKDLHEKGYKVIIVDFHAESGIEKKAFGFFLDGRVSAVLGTHTHIQTADPQIFKNGTAYITDCGMCGALDSVVGVNKKEIIEQYRYNKKVTFHGATDDIALCGVYIEIDTETGKSIKIESFCEREKKSITSKDILNYLKSTEKIDSLSELSKFTFDFLSPFFPFCPNGGILNWDKTLKSFVKRYLHNISGEEIKHIKNMLLSSDNQQKLGGFARIPYKDKNLIYSISIYDNSIFFLICEDTKLPDGIENILEEFNSRFNRLTSEILLKQKVKEVSSLYEVGKVIGSTLELYGKEGLLDRIMAMVTQVMNAEACSVLLVDEKTKELYFEIGQGEKGEEVKQIRLKIGQGIAGWVAENGKPCIVPDTSKDNRFFKKADDKTKFQTKSIIAVPMKTKDKVIGVLEVLNKKGETTFNRHDQELIEAISNLAVNSIDNAKLYESIKKLYKSTIQVLSNAMDSKDPYTHGHSRRVAKYSVEIAKKMGMNMQQVEDINFAALLHDIGKIGIRDSILCKPGKLTDEEFNIIRDHPVISAQILAPVEFLKDKIPMVKHHHEKYNGTGYPDKLAGKDIPLGARIISVADAFDAMTSDRSYRKGMSFKAAIKELENCKNTQFDPEIVDIFKLIYEEKKDSDLFNLEIF